MTLELPKLSYLCPACGNPYYGSAIGSYTVFETTTYSDGFVDPGFPPRLWMTKCPRCGSIFAKEHLFLLPYVKKWKNMAAYLDDCQRASEKEKERERLYGTVDCTVKAGDSAIEFLEGAIRQGLYFPVTVTEAKKEEFRFLLHKTLWWEYNQSRKEVDDETYEAFCHGMIEMLLSMSHIAEKELILAELYRNIGRWEESLAWLNKVPLTEKAKAFVVAIDKALEAKNTATVVVRRCGARL
ncbi:MAG: hypothetical protein J6S44_06305 [Clostridia bacterium]|nr:hypothetical protein [Clostridia bacterium]MBO7169756.1 hypothetical protein [Clostridia bacterium]